MAKSFFTLGLDVGIGSCGWALLDMKNEKIIDLGVRLWDVPQEPKTKESTATTRRNARSSRRNTKRTVDRKNHCFDLLKSEGLVPQDANRQWLQTIKGDKPTIKLRARGLDTLLSEREWAQVLYTLCSRRGYIPHGEGNDDTEGKKVLSAIEANDKMLKENGCRTVGEMLYKQKQSRNHSDNYEHCVSNSQIQDEINVLFDSQKQLGNKHTSNDFKTDYLECLTWQRDVTDYDARIYSQVGKCEYFSDEPRSAKSCLSFELCVAFERLGHTIIVDQNGIETHLPSEIRKQAIETLFSPTPINKNKECRVRYSDIRKWCDLDADSFFKGINLDDEKKEIFEPKCWRSQRKNLSPKLVKKMRENRELADAIDSALTYSSSRKSLMQQLDEIDINNDERDAILNLNFTSKLYKGYGNRSLRALDLLLDAFDSFDSTNEIITLYDAEEASGLADKRLHEKRKTSETLPPYKLFDNTCKNPVVLRVMGQVRKIINAISKEYGVPGEIHIELARELKHSKKEREQIQKAIKESEAKREVARTHLAEDLHCTKEDVTRKQIDKYLLWEEQDGRDLYKDKKIEYEKLISDETYCEIDHILPYSRTSLDGQTNKVLVLRKTNQEKKQQTPYEWLEPQGLWDDFKLRILRNKHCSRKKKDNFLVEKLDKEMSQKFIERNLNDTRYASRSAKEYIEEFLAFPDTGRKKHAIAVSGGVTSTLRNAWGIRKDRKEDVLHHALDAAVIAACNESAIMKVGHAQAEKSITPKNARKSLFEQSEPWNGFTKELNQMKKSLIPTRMANHGVTGRTFEDTLYRYEGLNESKTKGILKLKKESKPKVSSNYILHVDGSASIIDGLAFLRLWWDPDAPVRGRKDSPGRYFAEPVYYADIPAIKRGDYTPQLAPPQTGKKPREMWDKIPEHLLDQKPITLFTDDAIFFNGLIRRFKGFNIDTNCWTLSDPRGELTAEEATKGFPYSAIGPNDEFFIIQEDCLGHCFRQLLEN